MSHRFSTVAIMITATTFAGFAVWLSLSPDALLTGFGIEATTPQMRTEIRAFYGGIELAIAVAMIVLWKRGDLFAALLIGGLPLAASAAGRCIGMAIDGFFGLHAAMAVFEAIGATVCLVGCGLNSKSVRAGDE